MDLLADRSTETLAEWLLRHRGVEVVARDRMNGVGCGGRLVGMAHGAEGGRTPPLCASRRRTVAWTLARSSPDSLDASASSRTVSRLGAIVTPRSKSLMPRGLKPAFSASCSSVSPAAVLWCLSRSPRVAGSPDGMVTPLSSTDDTAVFGKVHSNLHAALHVTYGWRCPPSPY